MKIYRAWKKPGQQEHFPQPSLCIRNTTEETGRSVATKMKFLALICNLKCQAVTEVFWQFHLWKDIRKNLSGSIIQKISKNKLQFGHCLRRVQVKLAFRHSCIAKPMAGFTDKLYAVQSKNPMTNITKDITCQREHQIAWNNYDRIYMARSCFIPFNF